MAIIKYKKGNSWISIPIYVNTGGEVLDYVSKAELESMGYISELKTINNLSLIGSGNINIAVDLSNYYTKSEVNGLIPSLNNYYKKSETYSQSEVNALIDSVNAGDVDLSNYYTKTEVDELIPDDYLTSSSLSGYATQTWVNNKNYAKAADIPTLMSELTNDLGYLTSADLEDATSPIVRSYNEFLAWNAFLDNSTSALEILLYGNMAMDPLNNYSEVLTALKSENKIIHIGSESLDIELAIHPVKMENNYNSTGIIHGRIKDTTINNQWYQISGSYSSSLSDSASYASTLYILPDSYMPVDVQLVTYDLLKTYADNGKLIPGRKYAIIDYSCIYIQPISNIEMEVAADDIEQIICAATSANTLDENVTVKRSYGYAKIIECRYSIDPNTAPWTTGMTSKTPKGVIYHMVDEYENEANYDFKHVKFRRYAITDISANTNAANGSKNNESPYRYMSNSASSYMGSASDERFRVGSGEPTDLTMVSNIFNGTWSACTTDLSSIVPKDSVLYPFTSTYARNCHKPYTRTDRTTDKYLAWQTDMNTTEGLTYSSYLSRGIGGLSTVTVNSQDYIDAFTFHYLGGDLSETGTVRNVKLNNLVHKIPSSRSDLSNTCFILSDGQTADPSVMAIENVTINTGKNNTFLLRNYRDANDIIMYDVYFNHMRSCLIILNSWNSVKFNGLLCRYNYINADLYDITVNSSWTYNVIFGHIQRITAGNMQWNLWYNAFQYIQWNNSSSWISTADGTISSDCVIRDFVYANILGPIQYTTLHPHINGCTMRCVYNKGNEIKANKLVTSFGCIAYSTFEYGGESINYGNIINCYLECVPFYEPRYYHSSGNISGWNSAWPRIPNLQQVHVCGQGYDSTVSYVNAISNLSSSLKAPNTGGGKLVLFYNSSSKKYETCNMYNVYTNNS